MKKLLIHFILSFSMMTVAFAQTKEISGRVISTNADPLPGVSVRLKGSPSTGTQTNANGVYTLTVPSDAKTLVFTFISFRMKEVPITSTTLNVTLEEDLNNLTEIVVVGYGTQSKKDVTGAISQVKAKDLENLPVTSFESALQGRVAGVMVSSTSGKLGQGINVQVRGAASVTANSQPFYVVDGIPYSTSNLSSTTAPTNPLADLNPADIESIEILKDAYASAIYGARAANGVVLITTKQGKIGKTAINFSAIAGVSNPTNHREFLNAEQYVQLMRRAGVGAANYEFNRKDYDTLEEALLDYEEYIEGRLTRYSAGNEDYKTYKVNSNWEKAAFQDNPTYQQYDLNFTGGNEKTKFYIGGQALDQNGTIVGNSYKRYSGRLNLTNNATDFLEVGVNLNFTNSINNRLSNDNAFSNPIQAVALSPITPFIDPRSGLVSGTLPGEASNFPVYYNPFISIDNSFYQATTYRTVGKAFANLTLLKGLKFTTEFSVDNTNQDEESYYGSLTFRNTGSSGGNGENISTTVMNTNINNFFNYDTKLGEKGILSATLGNTYQKSTTKFSTITGADFPSDAYKKLGSAATKLIARSNEQAFSFLSYFFRTNYKYDDKYIVGFSIRRDGSSRFGSNVRYGDFPAASFAWIASEESFLKPVETISLLKLRLSYGLVGNADIGNYAAKGLYSGTGAYGGLPGQVPSQLANPDLTWEKTKELNIGLDFGILKNRITGTFDYYDKRSDNFILSRPVPQTTGYAFITENIGALTNKGFEIGINTENFTGDFKWSTSFTAAVNKNKITELGGQVLNDNEINAAIAGQPIGVFYMPEYAGVDPANGDALYYLNSTNENGTINRGTTNSINEAQRIFAGNSAPKYTFGINNSFSYKNIELGVFFQGVQGNKIFNAGGTFMSANGSNGFDNQTVDQMDYWNAPGDVTDVPEPRFGWGNGAGTSTRYLSDGSYLRLKTLTLAYNFPAEILKKIKVSRLKIFATAQNLLTITGYDGWDPEVNADYQATNINQGVDFYSAPQPKVISLGLNISL